LVAVLREISELLVLQKVDEARLYELAARMRERTVAPGEVIVRQGEPVARMFIVSEGDVSEQRIPADSEEPVARTASRGACFGAPTMLGNTPQKCTVVAETAASLWTMNRDCFDAFIQDIAKTGELGSCTPALEEDSEEADDEEACDVSDVNEVFIVSDGTGECAKQSVVRAMRQFEYCFGTACGMSRTTVYRFLSKAEDAKAVAEEAADREALVIFTVMDRGVNETLAKVLEEKGVEYVDLWAGLLGSLEKKFGAPRSGISSRKQVVSKEYMQIIKAIEYTRKVDDGILPNMWKDCDIMLVGPSRAGKTPLAFYLAQRGYKVANYPIVPDEEPPKELFELDQTKVFALIIQPERLREIRVERMAQFGRKNTKYASLENIKKEVRWMQTFYMRRGPKWPMIDTTNSGVVETAARIVEILDRRKGSPLAAAFTVSSITS